MGLGRLGRGERIFGAAAILLFGLMCLPWFGAEISNSGSNLLSYFRGTLPDRNAWEALGPIAVVLLVTVVVALTAVWLRLAIPGDGPRPGLNAAVAALGLGSVLLILFRIVDPPVLYAASVYTVEVGAQLPVFLALAAALGVGAGGLVALREERRGVYLFN